MLSTLEIDGKKLSPIKEAAQVTKYSRDYITRLAREEKIVASSIGRQWFVDLDSLRSYAESVALEQSIRKQQLSEERKRERKIREAVEASQTLRVKKSTTLHQRSLVAATLVLGCGLMGGLIAHQVFSPTLANSVKIAQLPFSPQSERMPAQTSGAVVSHVNENIPAVPTPTSDVRPMGDRAEGVLLLPQSGSIESVDDLFSDVVLVQKTAEGTETVVMVDAAGNQIGNEIPFVVVPVTESKR
ncbi:MAG: helix-turn-helix domain-containing protein [Candidatus Pacebacteria bacterium]|nr:helix-turn-helix domain-containing protein [Candidatus Paceibacterota bacterium]